MTFKAFDVQRLRQNWDRAAAAPAVPLHERLARVPVARDPYPEAARLLERIGQLGRAEFARHERSWGPFLAEASALLTRLREADGAATSATAVEAKPADLREDCLKVLQDLQDLFEVYAGIGLK